MDKIKVGKRYYFNTEWTGENATGRWKTGLVSSIKDNNIAVIVDNSNITWEIPFKYVRKNP